MILSIDIGGTSAKLALLDESLNIVSRTEAATAFDGYRTPILNTVLNAAKDFSASQPLIGVGISATGQIDSRCGRVIGTNGKIPNYEGAELAQAFRDTFHVPAFALNDANAAALGECAAQAGETPPVCALMVTFGTGIGGGIILNGKLYEGNLGIAGEIGQCRVGSGTFEEAAATTALIRHAEALSGESRLNGKIIFDRAASGDPVMLKALDVWTDAAAEGLLSLLYIFAPERILIGGGVSVQEQLFIEPLRSKVLTRALPRFAENVSIERAILGNDAGLYGAARYLLDRLR